MNNGGREDRIDLKNKFVPGYIYIKIFSFAGRVYHI